MHGEVAGKLTVGITGDKMHLTGEAPIGAAKRGKRCPGPGPPAAQPITALTVEFQTVKYETVSKVLS